MQLGEAAGRKREHISRAFSNMKKISSLSYPTKKFMSLINTLSTGIFTDFRLLEGGVLHKESCRDPPGTIKSSNFLGRDNQSLAVKSFFSTFKMNRLQKSEQQKDFLVCQTLNLVQQFKSYNNIEFKIGPHQCITLPLTK